jgi:pyruvate/2-oxoglutarate dehydrogenase complex dihydrolipoamide acyltransferase (E2) component
MSSLMTGVLHRLPMNWMIAKYSQRSPANCRVMLPLSLSYDHRAVNAANAVRFVRTSAEKFENPSALT